MSVAGLEDTSPALNRIWWYSLMAPADRRVLASTDRLSAPVEHGKAELTPFPGPLVMGRSS